MAKKVLVVEDDPATLRLVEYLLKKEKLNVILAKDGREGLRKVQERPDLIILDIMLPEMSGLEIIEKLKNNKDLRKIPIMILSSLGEEALVSSALKKGADEYIVKPFATGFLIAEVKRLLKM